MKYLFLHTLVLYSIVVSAQQFTLTGQVSGLQQGKLYLGYMNAEGKRVNDSTLLNNGQFTFSGNINEPVMAFMNLNTRLTSSDDPNMVSFFLEPTNMTMHMAYNRFKDAVITGSTTQNEYSILQKQQQKFQKRWKIVLDTLSAINKRSNTLYQETKAWALSPYQDEWRELSANFIQDHPASYVTAWLLRFEGDLSTDSLKKLYTRFPEKVKQSSFGKVLALDLEKRRTGIPGAKAALFTSDGIDDKPVSLADFKGKYVLIDFWASWCVPCRKGNPHLKDLYAKYKAKGFEVIGVSDDDRKPGAWKKAVEQDGLPWKHVLRGMKVTMNGDVANIDHSNDISEGYNIRSLPTQVLIDPNGMIIGRYGDGLGESHAALDKKLEEIFK
jgi:thiol-disulfide isomerase/thioredoxin